MTDNSKHTGVALEKAYQFVLWLVPTVEKFPRAQKFLLGDRMQSTALDVVEGLVEATYTRNRAPVLRAVNLRLEKLRVLFRLATDLQILDLRRYEHAARTIDEIGRLVGGWLRRAMPPKRHNDLFSAIASFSALRAAAKRAIKGKRRKPMPAAFMAGLEREILKLERELQAGSYRPGGYVEIRVEDPKPRIVSAAPFRDRVVHHALCAVIEPIFERGFIFDSYANRLGKGTHAAVARYKRYRDHHAHVLRCDIFRYFPSIDHAILKTDLRRRIACQRTLWLIDAIIDGANPQEPVHIHYPGDDLFTPFVRRRGLPLGNLTSQFFANLYLDGLDHFCTEVLRTKAYLRYVDDVALFHEEPGVLEVWRRRIADYLAGRRLTLHPRKTLIRPTAEPAAFLGCVLAPGRRRLPEDNVRRFRNRWRGLRDRVCAGTLPQGEAARRVRSWIAHAEHADTWRLRQGIFRGGPFDPAGDPFFRDGPRGPKREPGRSPLAIASTAAAPGTTIRGTSARPTATGTNPVIGTTIRASGLPARPQPPEPERSRTLRVCRKGVQDRP